ncbi:MAG TPA: glycosyltransferase family 2 protein [Gemmatimonadales bacterium]|nr:glycosyltransferase family 2 protein [Gemmatimonadales bacterium]
MPSSARPRLVVLAPVRNEAWILERFLAVTSTFADLILVADQGSTDGSRAICARFPKVQVIDNPERQFDEGTRRATMVEEARARVPLPRILLAFDADEVLAADAPGRAGWNTMLAAAPGTVLSVELVDLYLGTDRCMRHDPLRPFGFVDDGTPFRGRVIHGARLPLPPGAPELRLGDLKLLHYAAAAPARFAAKLRWYSCLENVLGSCKPPLKRRLRYLNHLDYTWKGRLEPTRPEWFAGWEACGIDMHSIPQERYSWFDVEVLRWIARYGERRFWMDDIWRFDWEGCRQWAVARGFEGIPARPIRPAPALVVQAVRGLSLLHREQVRIRHRLTGRKSRRFA